MSASKHAIEGLSESLRRELMLFGIDVIMVAPGAVKTPIWSKAEEVDISAYSNSPYLPALEKVRAFTSNSAKSACRRRRLPKSIAEALTSAHPKVRYSITPGSDAAPDHGDPAETDGRQDHRQASRAAAAAEKPGIGRRPSGKVARRQLAATDRAEGLTAASVASR